MHGGRAATVLVVTLPALLAGSAALAAEPGATSPPAPPAPATTADPHPGGTRVVLLEPQRAGPLVRQALTRAEAELRSAGFTVTRVKQQGDDARASLASSARAHQAMAAISLSVSPGGAAADVWVVERLTDKTLIRHVDVSSVAPNRRPFALALRAVELLRASLFELEQAGEGTAPMSDPVARLLSPATHPPLRGFGVELGVGALFSIDRLEPAVAPMLRVSYGGVQGLALRGTWLPPLMNNSEQGPLGDARVRQQLFTIGGVYAPDLDGAPIVPIASLELGAYHLIASGELRPPALSRRDDVWAFALSAGGGGLVRFNQTFGLALQLSTVVTLPRAVVTMQGTPVGSAGLPSWLLSLGGVGHF